MEVTGRTVAPGCIITITTTTTAPFYYRMLVTGEPIDTGVADRAAATAAAAARAGIPTATF